ncbi:MAG TPA: YggS family pyridoxal phosphate-dependent enzyme [Anaerolineae bacterium]|jgi:pyridoxal phosphate enzyme (YggS family)|nr:YggS family pyridoxal phosphate-dependent enzyme [Anaerolineae bacterium]
MDDKLVSEIRARLEDTQEKIARAAQSAGRNPGSVRLVVVTKTHPVESVQAAIQAGAQYLGENYAEEAVAKRTAIGDGRAEWHMIGHVQSRKADLVARYFDMLHSLDSLKLASRLKRFSAETSRTLPVLLEVNVSGEGSKFGYPAWAEAQWPALRDDVLQICSLSHLQVRGLMSMPPFADEAEESRPFFVRLRRLQEYLSKQVPAADWAELSMGTSVDFAVAVEEGATLVRVGTAIMGQRQARG